jgi:hypothetical protein
MIAKLAVGIGLASILALSAVAEEARSDLFSQQPGRYQIIVSPHVAKHTFMIDTATGRVWQLVQFNDLKGEPNGWQLMPRVDGDADLFRVVGTYGIKPKETPGIPLRVRPETSGRIAEFSEHEAD